MSGKDALGGSALVDSLQGQSGREMTLKAYQKWLHKNVALLVCGDITAWSHYTAGKDYLLARFPELHSHMAPTMHEYLETHEQPLSKETMCTRLGINLSYVLQLEEDGYVRTPCGELPRYSHEDQKKIYWALFFEKEMGITRDDLGALLSFVDLVGAKVAYLREMLHDLGTPLHIIGGRAHLLRRKLPHSEIAEKNLTIIQTQVEKMIELLHKYHEDHESVFSEMDPQNITCE